MSARVKETAKEEALHVRKLAEDGVKSGAYIYPLKVGNAVSVRKKVAESMLTKTRASTTSLLTAASGSHSCKSWLQL